MNIAKRRPARSATLLAPMLSIALLTSCGAFEESPATPTPQPISGNLLVDAGFEGTAPAWVAFPPAGAHDIVSDPARGGGSSMALRLSPEIGALSVTQSLNPAAFPEFLSGYYRVDDWPDDAFLQFVVRAPGGAPEEVREVRFVIAGTASDPEAAAQAKYVYLSRGAPEDGEWVYFAYPIRQAFEARVGVVPQAWNSIDISLEARSLGGTPTAAVYFDDMYVGTQAENPNRPKETTK